MTNAAIIHDLNRCIGRLENICDSIRSADYRDQRRAAGMAQEAVAELLIDMAETLNWLTDAGELSKTDRMNIRSYVHDGFIEAIDLADERGLNPEAA
ncbi:MAG: hypothetical protein Kow0026_08450 [Oricola sp.]